jgi:hypothetical protein
MDADGVADLLGLPRPDHLGRSEYQHVLDWLAMMVGNAEYDGRTFDGMAAIRTLHDLEAEVRGVRMQLRALREDRRGR